VSLKPLINEGVHIEWMPWKMPEEANPPNKPEGYGDHAKEFLQQLLADLKLQINPPTAKYDTYLSHVGGKYAKEKGRFDDYHQRVFERVWIDSENIGDVEVLKSIAKESGLDPNDFEKSLTNSIYREQVDADFQLAVEHKIWTIPSYKAKNGEIQVNHFEELPSVKELKKIL
jgi:predicted DsbA family dithiol-disulfide isomerase